MKYSKVMLVLDYAVWISIKTTWGKSLERWKDLPIIFSVKQHPTDTQWYFKITIG